jgi:predicted nuclease with TOPRIM domain
VKESLQKRLEELSSEIREYPTPIARCDEQLAQLLEERSALITRLKLLEDQGSCSPVTTWINDGGINAA